MLLRGGILGGMACVEGVVGATINFGKELQLVKI
jgi:hypothetical protein